MEQKVYVIQELLPKFRELNAVYTSVIERGSIFYSEQILVTKFYQEYRDTSAFERMMINLMLVIGKEKYQPLIEHLQTELEKNITQFENHHSVFSSLDIYNISRTEASFYDEAIREQLQRTNEYGKELTGLKNSYEEVAWNRRKEDEEVLQRKINQVQPLYDEERKKLDVLYWQQKEIVREAEQYSRNFFAEIYTLNKTILSILASYFTKTKSELKDKDGKSETKYFSMKLIAAIYEECNNQQFEDVPETKYYSFFNLFAIDEPLQIKSGEKTRVYYLLHKMYESLSVDTKQHWRNEIFKLLTIDEKNYFSKYREPVSEIPAKKSKAFAKTMDDIFEVYV